MSLELQIEPAPKTSAHTVIWAGKKYTVFCTLNGHRIPADNLTDVEWRIGNSNHCYHSVSYTHDEGIAVPSDLKSYPLTTIFMPAKPYQQLIPSSISLSAVYHNGSYNIKFDIAKGYDLQLPAYCSPPEAGRYFDMVKINRKEIDKNKIQYTLTTEGSEKKHRKSGIVLRTGYTSIAATGVIYGINLVDEEVYRVNGDVHHSIATTHKAYWYDGNKYPYTEEEIVSKPGEKDVVEFIDTPDFRMGQEEEDAKFVSYRFRARTYFFYDDKDNAESPTHPVLLTSPIEWGYSAELKYIDSNHGFIITASAISPLMTIHSMSLPQWDNFIREDELDTKK
ncbi:hypothetical protein AU210_005575 [Fusarium oxysporum f. sp. radicis-cucumerinum]|uniref:Uncharacterized protein n=2 Tax=Fusarium oxysporum TaxID=5507 RepID=A0A2H3H4P0_FUSOX|nr:hypothetical protein AU210_005575 [Fusarium oxysporum f. sp. radicis-cucumerinum]RKK92357.1 hypothetical protein BFJ71_g10210 [Fusarium oxysporum]RKL21196.1 hypothetical protein BFJ68_g2465 [Fusarium oxysporum]